jgi:hypothetical protein
MKKDQVVIRLGAGKRSIEFGDHTVDLNAADKATYGALMKGLRQGFTKKRK